MKITSIEDIKPGEKFKTVFGDVYVCKKVGMMPYPALLTKEDCTPVPAVTAQGKHKDKFWIIALADLETIL